MHQPDQTDWEIIALLNKDGRMSSAEIARQLGNVTARTITNRIDALTDHGIINIRSIVNPDVMGYSTLADVFVEVEPGTSRSVAEHLAELSLITYVVCAIGETDIIASVRARNIKELYDFVIEVIGKIPDVHHTQTFPLPLRIKNNVAWMPPGVLEDEEADTPTTLPHVQGE